MTAELFVKDTVCARDHSGKRLTPTTFEGTNWGAIKTQIFDQCRPHMENKASYANAPREWSVSLDPLTYDDFDCFVSIKMGRTPFKPTSSALAQRYLVDHVNETFTVLVYKWGNNINNASDFQQFQEQCVQVPERDKSGAAAESVHQAMVVQLKKKWGSVYRASEAAWRIWAAGILKKPLYLHAANVGMAPPSNVLPSLQRVLRVADKRLAQHNMHLPLTIVNSCLEDLDGLKGAAQEIVRRLDASMCNLKAQKRMLEAMVADLQPSKVPKFGRGGMLAIPTNSVQDLSLYSSYQ
ncbi:hypothetical protein DYB37_008730 [Aphanomyces astaci]|uniref:Uncharacterized protein n=1 Tax=Aphanomyces astaci TaxID=112090 RepID=A0A418E2I5_APHAT|nr:hypothetical protein DYB37_008730 [Aphanomyces astaci]